MDYAQRRPELTLPFQFRGSSLRTTKLVSSERAVQEAHTRHDGTLLLDYMSRHDHTESIWELLRFTAMVSLWQQALWGEGGAGRDKLDQRGRR